MTAIDLGPGGPGDGHPPLVLDGVWRAAPADDALRRAYPDPEFDDGSWEGLTVPGHWRRAPAFAALDGPVLHRRRFETPAGGGDGRRRWLVLDGVFYTSDVWLDGNYLGDTEGYFFPHAFDVTAALADRREHTLAVEVACRPELDHRVKRNLTGVFQHWDLHDLDWNPGGIWRPVRIETSGPVRIVHWRVRCTAVTDSRATVAVRAVLDSAEATEVAVRTAVAPEGRRSGPAPEGRRSGPAPEGAGDRAGADHHQLWSLAQGENRLEWTVTVPEPRRWWPHSLGDQPLYDVTVSVLAPGPGDAGEAIDTDEPATLSDERRLRLGLRTVTARDWIFSVNGERLFLKGSNQGPARVALGEATAGELAADVDLAVAANLDFLRIHAHVSRPELYDAADRAGLLLWQDLPLQWGYARGVRTEARRQAREAVDLLAHHPSVFLWCAHNEPMAIEDTADVFGDRPARARIARRMARAQLLPSYNKTFLDRSLRSALNSADGTRPVVPHSGVFPHPPTLSGTDTHLYLGWYQGRERTFPAAMRVWPRLARFVSEFGAQAVPDEAGFLHPERWPDLDWEEAHRAHALQKGAFDRHVPPADFATFEAWRDATQAYQADVIRFHIETLRRLKYRPCGGFAQFCFADGQPAVTWSVLDHDRRPKRGYATLAAACAPVVVLADRPPATVAPGEPLALDLHVVNDRHIALSDMMLTAYLCWGTSDPAGSVAGPTTTQHRWRWRGDVPADDCTRIGTVSFVVPDAPGSLALELALAPAGSPDAPVATNRYGTVIAHAGG
jgi:beta-mannosidase